MNKRLVEWWELGNEVINSKDYNSKPQDRKALCYTYNMAWSSLMERVQFRNMFTLDEVSKFKTNYVSVFKASMQYGKDTILEVAEETDYFYKMKAKDINDLISKRSRERKKQEKIAQERRRQESRELANYNMDGCFLLAGEILRQTVRDYKLTLEREMQERKLGKAKASTKRAKTEMERFFLSKKFELFINTDRITGEEVIKELREQVGYETDKKSSKKTKQAI